VLDGSLRPTAARIDAQALGDEWIMSGPRRCDGEVLPATDSHWWTSEVRTVTEAGPSGPKCHAPRWYCPTPPSQVLLHKYAGANVSDADRPSSVIDRARRISNARRKPGCDVGANGVADGQEQPTTLIGKRTTVAPQRRFRAERTARPRELWHAAQVA